MHQTIILIHNNLEISPDFLSLSVPDYLVWIVKGLFAVVFIPSWGVGRHLPLRYLLHKWSS